MPRARRPPSHPDDDPATSDLAASDRSVAAGASTADDARRPLIVCADDQLLDELLRLSAAAGVEPQVAHDAGSALPALVGRTASSSSARTWPTPSRRPACRGGPRSRSSRGTSTTRRVWQRAVAVGAAEVVLLPDGADWVVDRARRCLRRRARRRRGLRASAGAAVRARAP